MYAVVSVVVTHLESRLIKIGSEKYKGINMKLGTIM